MAIERYFERLGFKPNDQRVYLCLAEVGKSTAGILARRCQLPRSTIYSTLESLLKQKLIATERARSVTYYSVNRPGAFIELAKRQQQDAERGARERLEAAAELTDLLGPYFKSKHYSVPKLRFFEGTANVRSMLYDNLGEWQHSVGNADFTWWGYQDHAFVEQYGDWITHHGRLMAEHERVRLFSNQSQIERSMKGRIARREIRLVPEGLEFSSTIWIIGEYVITLMIRQKPHYAFQLKDAVFATNQRTVFRMLWQLTK